MAGMLLLLLRLLQWLVRLLRLLLLRPLLLLPLLLLLLLLLLLRRRRPLLLRHARLLGGRWGGRRGPLAASVPAGHPEGQQALLGGQLAPQLPELRVRCLHKRHDGAGAVLRVVVVALQELRPHHKLAVVQATRLQLQLQLLGGAIIQGHLKASCLCPLQHSPCWWGAGMARGLQRAVAAAAGPPHALHWVAAVARRAVVQGGGYGVGAGGVPR